jgi:hypothetical protein
MRTIERPHAALPRRARRPLQRARRGRARARDAEPPAQLPLFEASEAPLAPPPPPSRHPWAWLLRRVSCGGRMRVVHIATTPEGVERVLAGKPTRARAPPPLPSRRRSFVSCSPEPRARRGEAPLRPTCDHVARRAPSPLRRAPSSCSPSYARAHEASPGSPARTPTDASATVWSVRMSYALRHDPVGGSGDLSRLANAVCSPERAEARNPHEGRVAPDGRQSELIQCPR